MAAAALGGILAPAVIKEVTRMLSSAIGGEIKLQWNCKRDLREMKDTLETIEAVLQDAEMRSITEKEVQLWMKRLKNAAYDISDMLAKMDGKTANRAARKHVLKIPRLPNITMPHKVKKMRRRLKNITDEHQRFGFKEGSASNEQQLSDRRETWSKIEAPIVGRSEEMKKILSCLSNTIPGEIMVLPIYGMGGIGKTTMAKMVFNDAHFSEYSQAWVYVSRTFDLNNIGNSIISQLSNEKSQLTERQMIQTSLGRLVSGKKILIVLDDLWEHNPFTLDELKAMLNVGNASMVTVIVTTRDKKIADRICTIEPHELPLLNEEMCWTIIKQKVGLEARPNKGQESVGREIALKCGGVALAAHAIGYMLQSMAIDKWESVRDSDIWNQSTWGDNSHVHHAVFSSLILSYNSMPLYLKSCFAYCATFAKGYKIMKEDLIYQWISLGFVEPPTSMFTSWQHGENYVTHLMGMSFLQYSKSPASVGVNHEEIALLTMHDLVHDIARYIMVDEIIDSSKQGNVRGGRYRFALLNDCSMSLKSLTPSPTKIWALRYLESENNMLHGSSFSSKYLHLPICGKIGLHDDIFSSASYLRVLDLSECSIQQLPISIGHLKQLRYLKAPRVQHRAIPDCITRLSKLIYLNLCGSSEMLALPESIGEMESLMHLDLSGCSGIQELPESFGKLTKLQNLKHLSLSRIDAKISAFFGNLKSLIHLDLSYCSEVEGVHKALDGLTKLQYLNLSCCCSRIVGSKKFEGLENVLCKLKELRYLYLSRYLARTVGQIQRFEGIQVVKIIESICSLSNMEYLDLSENQSIRRIPEDICNLRKLHTLDLSRCNSLSRLPESIADMVSLRFLSVSGCDKLDKSKIPEFTSSSRLSLPHFVVHALDGESSGSNLVRLEGVNPPELEICRLENVKATEEAARIRLKEKHDISTLKLDWTIGAKRFVEDLKVLGELVPPARNLEEFCLQGYNSKYFPDWLMGIEPYHFPNLVRITMVDLPTCTRLPPLGQLPVLEFLSLEGMHGITKIDKEICGGKCAFRRLREFTLSRMESLREWYTTYYFGEDGVNEFMFPVLEILEIRQCPVLCFNPCPPKVDMWKIDSSDCVLSSWGAPHSPSRAKSLSVESCRLPLHRWRFLHHLTALRCLCIKFCRDLSSSAEITQVLSSLQLEVLYLEVYDQSDLPSWMRELTSLRTLTLSECGFMESLPDWLGGLTSLCELRVYKCPNLNNLESMERVTSLEWLCLMDCENIPALPEGLGNLIALRKLEIIRCEGIMYFPESLHKLANLKTLDITGCPALRQWCNSEENKAKIPHNKDKVVQIL